MDVKEFLKLLAKYKLLVILIPVITLVITFLVLRNMPKEFKAEAKLSTGILDPSRQVAPEDNYYSGPDILMKINQQFTNIMDMMRMPKNINILSYRLILNDLRNPEKPFTPYSELIESLSKEERAEAIKLFEERLENKKVLTFLDNGKIKLYDIVKSVGYDEKTLNKKLKISHENNSDFIFVSFTSANSFLSVFVVNTLSKDFISNYSNEILNNKNKSIDVLDSLLKNKEAVMNQKISAVQQYKIRNKVLNLDKQSQIVYQQIVDQEQKKYQTLLNLKSLQSALNNVNSNLNNRSHDKYLGAEVSADNKAIIELKAKILDAENAYIDSRYSPNEKRKLDSLQNLLTNQLLKANDQYVNDPLIAKQSLVLERISLGVELDKTKAIVNEIDNDLENLNAKFSKMVPYDADVHKLESEADVATREYLELLNRYNQTSLDKNIGLTLRLEQEGIPTDDPTSKKIFYVALCVVASLAICFFIIFTIHLLDNSIYDKEFLIRKTKGKVIGELNFIKPKNRNIDEIWKYADQYKDLNQYKNRIRSLRFELVSGLLKSESKVLGITPYKESTASPFTIVSLVYAFSILDKKILVLGNDALASELSSLNIKTDQKFNAVLDTQVIRKDGKITFLNSNLEGLSLLEKEHKSNINKLFNSLKNEFDFIIIGLEDLSKISDIKEWILFTDKYVSTFTAGHGLRDVEVEDVKLLNNDPKFLGWILDGERLK